MLKIQHSNISLNHLSPSGSELQLEDNYIYQQNMTRCYEEMAITYTMCNYICRQHPCKFLTSLLSRPHGQN